MIADFFLFGPPMTDVVEVNDARELSCYQVAWTALHAETRGASFFNTLEWLQTYWRHFGADHRLRVFVARSNNRPIGFVPMCEVVEPTPFGHRRVLTYPLDNRATSYVPVGPWPAATMALVMRHIAQGPKSWNILEPRGIPHQSVDNGRTERSMRMAGLPGAVIAQASTSLVDCDRFAGWEDYLARRSCKTRREIRDGRLEMARAGRVEHVAHRPGAFRNGDGDPRWDLFKDCLAMSQSSRSVGPKCGNSLSPPAANAYLMDVHEQACRAGMLDMHLLKVDGQPTAYFYGFHFGGRLTAVRMGRDASTPKNAGAVLLSKVVETAFAHGDRVIDLGAENESCKRQLRTSVETPVRISHGGFAAWRAHAESAVASLRGTLWATPKRETAKTTQRA